MENEKAKSQTYQQFYDYFKNGFNGNHYKLAGIITNRQCVLTNDRAGNGDDHYIMAQTLTQKTGHGTNIIDSPYTYFYGIADTDNKLNFSIILPESDNPKIPYSQYAFINDIISAFEDAKQGSNKEMHIELFSQNVIQDDIEKMREKLDSVLRKDIQAYIPEEKILSEENPNMRISTLDKETLKDDIIFSFDFKNTTSLTQLSAKLNLLSKYYKNDPLYQEAVNELLPSLDDLTKATSILAKNNSTVNLENLSINNLKEAIKNPLNELYNEKLDESQKTQNEIMSLSNRYKQLQAEEDLDKAYNSLYPQKQDSNRRLEDYTSQIFDVENKIKALNSEISQNSLIVNPESRTIFQKMRNLFTRIFNRGKIRNSQDIINNNSKEISNLEEELKNIKQQNDAEKQNNLKLEIDFKSVSGKDITLEDYKKEREKLVKDPKDPVDHTNEKNQIQEKIKELHPVLTMQKNELEEFEQTGLIDKTQTINIEQTKEEKNEDSQER